MVDFIEAGVYFKRLEKITAVEELSVFCHWEEDGIPVECFLVIGPLKRADAESIYLALAKCIRQTSSGWQY